MSDPAFYKQVWNGVQAVEALSQHAPTPELLQAAEQLRAQLYAGFRGPAFGYIAAQGESAVTEDIVVAMDTLVAAARQLAPEYSQPAFQCLADFDKCRMARKSKFMCGLVLAACLAERFVPKPEYVRQAQVSAQEVIAAEVAPSAPPRPGPTEAYRVSLRQNLAAYFNDSELRTLCFDMHVDYESLGGDNKADKVRELVVYCERRQITSDLVARCRALRPRVPWEDESGRVLQDSSVQNEPTASDPDITRSDDDRLQHFSRPDRQAGQAVSHQSGRLSCPRLQRSPRPPRPD